MLSVQPQELSQAYVSPGGQYCSQMPLTFSLLTLYRFSSTTTLGPHLLSYNNTTYFEVL